MALQPTGPGASSQTSDTSAAASAPPPSVVLLYATFPNADLALSVARQMVEAKLAGCVNVLPSMTSIYVWDGQLESAAEAVMIAKLAASGAGAAMAFITSVHPYETPAILLLPVSGGEAGYLAWLAAGTA
jgi:periplasmic divalent cation tolerance protein